MVKFLIAYQKLSGGGGGVHGQTTNHTMDDNPSGCFFLSSSSSFSHFNQQQLSNHLVDSLLPINQSNRIDQDNSKLRLINRFACLLIINI
ncbi:hypothetical protein DERP_002754 [Dermatophagoides pteronyssinus]|uniref:Uncharacterized protein n=1 Tax=Dermatophagoides pteronyssinus TaxID=6956 RepID=A0ABQ8JW62_DERPT|nr:hypothetical protein DERP_002754 [Dermatophagoides pteronyssinus]